MTNSKKVKEIMKKVGVVEEQLAREMKIPRAELHMKLQNQDEFKASELNFLARRLQLTAELFETLFFAQGLN